jgi:hypothetical protein
LDDERPLPRDDEERVLRDDVVLLRAETLREVEPPPRGEEPELERVELPPRVRGVVPLPLPPRVREPLPFPPPEVAREAARRAVPAASRASVAAAPARARTPRAAARTASAAPVSVTS